MFLDSESKTHADMDRMCKLHTDRPSKYDLDTNPGPFCCWDTSLTTRPTMSPIFFFIVLGIKNKKQNQSTKV